MTFVQLADAAQRGQLLRHDLVWQTGMEGWTPAMKVPGLWLPPPVPENVVATPGVPATTNPETPSTGDDRRNTAAVANDSRPQGLGVGGKIGLSILVFVVGTILWGIVKDPIMRDFLGPWERLPARILLQMATWGLILYIWTRPTRKANKKLRF